MLELDSKPPTPEIVKRNKFGQAQLSDFIQGDIIHYCRKWEKAPQDNPAPLIIGPVGCGKSHLLWALYFDLN